MSDDLVTRPVRIVRHTSARKVITADDWRARTEAEAIEARINELRATMRSEVEEEVRAELAEAFAVAAALRQKDVRAERVRLGELAVACAERLAGGAIERDPRRIRDIVSSVLEEAIEEGPVAVAVHPDALLHFENVKTLSVRADPSLAAGDCVVEVASGSFDGRLRIRAEQLTQALKALDD